MEEVYPREGVEEASVGGGGSHGQGLRMEADVGLHLFKDSRDGEGVGRGLPAWPVTGRPLAVGTPSHRWEQWPVTLAQLPPAQPALTATPPSPLVLSWSVDGPESDPARPSLPGASLLLPGHTFPGAKTRF